MSKCRYVGNIHPQVTEPLLQEVFATAGPLEGCKLIRKETVIYIVLYLFSAFFFV
jgi:nucleolysin TIA-1/TIAR